MGGSHADRQASARGRQLAKKHLLLQQNTGKECKDCQTGEPCSQQLLLGFRQPSGTRLWEILGNQSPSAESRQYASYGDFIVGRFGGVLVWGVFVWLVVFFPRQSPLSEKGLKSPVTLS